MKLLLEECVARDLKEDLAAHEVTTVTEAGYQGMKNGALLRGSNPIRCPYHGRSEFGFPTKYSLASNSNTRHRCRRITYDNLKPFSPRILEALGGIQPGEVVTVTS